MAGYIGSKAVSLSTTSADVTGDAEIGGDLTVDTDTLHVDSTNNQVGIGTTSPESKISVKGSSGSSDLFSISDTTVPTSGVEYGVAMIKTNSTDFALNVTGYNAASKGVRVYGNGGSSERTLLEVTRAAGTAMLVDGLGNVGIGTSSPNTGLSVVTGSANGIELGQDSDASTDSARLFFSTSAGSNAIHSSSGAMRFFTGSTAGSSTGTERMRIDSSGNLLVGSTSTDGFDGTSGLKVASSTAGFLLERTNLRGWLQYIDSSGGWRLYDSTANAERIRVDTSGQVCIGATSSSGGILHVEDSNVVLTSKVTFGTPGNAVNIQGLNNVGTVTFQVWGDGDTENSNNSYGAISDQTLKENIVDAGSQWDDIKSLQIRKYSFISDSLDAPNQIGVIAQELEASGMSGLVKNNPLFDESGDLTGETRKSVKYSILYMKAVKALQEAMDRIETLQTEMTSVKSRLDALEANE